MPKFRYWVLFIALASLAGCATLLPRAPVPEQLVNSAKVDDFHNIRFWGDPPPLRRGGKARFEVPATMPRPNMASLPTSKTNGRAFLALSGGGRDGAFGAGLLAGWSARGTRPRFDVVTGISTGALIAPFAFLGPRYDRQLRAIYTRYSTQDILSPQILAGFLGGNAAASSAPFADLIAKYVTRGLLNAIAREHRRGRRLLIGTTNIDAQRAVIWDMGAIAASRHRKRLELFRNVIRASASIPGAFPPVRIKVRADGQYFDELHVDGGITSQVFFLPPQIGPRNQNFVLKAGRPATLYIIRNGRIAPQFQIVEERLLPLSKRSLSTLTKSQANAELFELHQLAARAGLGYRLAAIPSSFDAVPNDYFDRNYMRKLFRLGYRLGARGYRWDTRPPY